MPPKRAAETERGFGAAAAVMLLAAGTLAGSLATLDAAAFYADGVSADESRIQRRLDDTACHDTYELMKAKDAFLYAPVPIPEFQCSPSDY